MTEISEQAEPKINAKLQWHYSSPIRYREAGVIRKDLNHFMKLTKLYFMYAGTIDIDIPPHKQLKKLLARKKRKDVNEQNWHDQLNTTINERIPIVYGYTRRIGTPVDYSSNEGNDFNIILDFFDITDSDRQNRYKLLIDQLERSIGVSEYVRSRFWRGRVWNPLYWSAVIVNLPLRIFEISGFNIENQKTSELYFWILKAIMIILLTLFVIKLGIEVNVLQVITKIVW